MGFTDSFKKVIGLSEISEDETITEEELQEEKKRIERESKSNREKGFTPSYQFNRSSDRGSSFDDASRSAGNISRPGEKRFSVTGTNSLKLILIEPNSFDECPKLVDSLKARKPIIINLEKLETETARKIFDFLSGATYALDGNVQKIANNIFIFTPENVSVAAQQQAQGLSMETEDKGRWG